MPVPLQLSHWDANTVCTMKMAIQNIQRDVWISASEIKTPTIPDMFLQMSGTVADKEKASFKWICY